MDRRPPPIQPSPPEACGYERDQCSTDARELILSIVFVVAMLFVLGLLAGLVPR